MTKSMPNGHEYLRHVGQAGPPPPPPPGRGLPPPAPLEEGGEAAPQLGEQYGDDDAFATRTASNKPGGTPMASMQQPPPVNAKGYRAANPNHVQAQEEKEVFVAESTSWVPSGSMALCGMPIKANKKE